MPSGVIVHVNGLLKLTNLKFNKNMNISAKTVTTLMDEGVLPVQYCPYSTVRTNIRQDDECSVSYLGKITYYCIVALTNANIQFDVTFHNKM